MRKRLVRSGTVDYQVLRSNDAWADHQARTLVTGSLIAWLKPRTIMDPACGDASIVLAASSLHPVEHMYLADISQPNIDHILRASNRRLLCTDIFAAMGEFPAVDVIVLTEILEHLPDPDHIVALAREKATFLVASSPVMRTGQVDTNPEHLWMFDAEGYREMLEQAGWTIGSFTLIGFPETEYDFGVWVCR